MYLLDTSIISELRRQRADTSVVRWFAAVPGDSLYLSVLTLGEIRRGVELARRKDAVRAAALDRWIADTVRRFGSRILPIDSAVAELWGELNVPDALPAVDGLLAATAIAHDYTLVTRNVRDVERSGCKLLNPFGS